MTHQRLHRMCSRPCDVDRASTLRRLIRCRALQQAPVLRTTEPAEPPAADTGSLAFDMQSSGRAVALRSLPSLPVDDSGNLAAPPAEADAGVTIFSREGLGSKPPHEAETAEAMPAAQPVAVPPTVEHGEHEQTQVIFCALLSS